MKTHIIPFLFLPVLLSGGALGHVKAQQTGSLMPVQVKKLHVEERLETAMTIKWQKQHKVDFYQVRLVNAQGKKLQQWKAKKNTKIIHELKPAQAYRFKARAVRDGKFGLWSKILKVKTKAVEEEDEEEEQPATPTPTTTDINIQNFSFSPSEVTIVVGDTVRWTNFDNVQHTVTSDDGTFASSDLLSKSATYEVTFDKAGTYTYHCTPHPYMTGTIVVE